MNKLTFFLCCITLFACELRQALPPESENKALSSIQIDSILSAFKFEYSQPVFQDSSDYILIPITTKLLDRRKTFSKDGYYDQDYPRYWNILFYNKSSGESRLLVETKLRISDFSTNLHKGGPWLAKSILYEVNVKDYNQNDKLEGNDPGQLFISNSDGTNFRGLIPENEDLQYYAIVPGSDLILARTIRDVNSDTKFDHKDEAIWYRIDVTPGSQATEMIHTEERKKIEHLYFEQWLK